MSTSSTVKVHSTSSGMVSPKKNDLLPVLAILTAVCLWGGSFSAMRVAINTLHPWTVVWFRMAIALVVLLPLIPKSYKPGDWKRLLLMVLCQPCFYFLFESYALTYTTSSQAGIISSTFPLMVLVGAWLTLSEKLVPRVIVGMVVSVVSVVVLTLFSEKTEAASNPILGNSLEVFAMLSAAINVLIIKKLSKRYDTWSLTGMLVLTGVIFFSPGIYFLKDTTIDVFTSQIVLSLVFLGALVTLAAFGLYNWGIGKIDASRASIFVNLVPVIAILLGWLVLDETLTFFQSFAAFGVILGVWISQKPAQSDSSTSKNS